MKYITLISLLGLLTACGGKNGEKDLNHIDTVKPNIVLMGSQSITLPYNTTYVDSGAFAKDERDGVLTDKITITGSVNNQLLGKYILTYSVMDKAGNSASTTRAVTVVDTIKPNITLVGNSLIEIPFDSTYTDTGAVATDNYDGNISNNIIQTGYVNTKLLGSYELEYKVKDSSGNESSASRTVVVKDIVKPVITLLGSSPAIVEVNTSYTDPGALAIDDYEGDISNNIQTTNNVNTSLLGSYEYTYNVSDNSNNNATPVSRTVNVIDTTKPILTLVGDNPLQVELGETYSDPGVSATDNYDTTLTVNEVINNIDMNTMGDYKIIFETSDSSGNKQQIERNVLVRDTIDPVLTVSPEEIVYQYGSVPSDVDELEGVSATDTNLDRIEVSGSVSQAEGTTTITYTAYDTSGNSSTKTRTYKVLNMPFLSLAKNSSPLLATQMGNIQRDLHGSRYDMIISNDQLFEVSDYSIYSSNTSHTFTNTIQPIPYNEEKIGKDRNIIYLIENNVGIQAVDISTSNTTLTPVKIDAPNITGDYQVDKSIITTKGLFFSVGNSIYFVANEQTTASLVVNIDPAALTTRGLYWTATGKYVMSFEIADVFNNSHIALYNVENNNAKTTLAERDSTWLSGDPDYSINDNSIQYTSDGKYLYAYLGSGVLFAMDENQIATFDNLGSEEIRSNSSRFNFAYKLGRALNNYYHIESFDDKLYGVLSNGRAIDYQNSLINTYPQYTDFGSVFTQNIYKMIPYDTNQYILFHKDSNNSIRIGLIDTSIPYSGTNRYNYLTVYDTMSKQEITFNGEFQGMVKYKNDYYIMPDNSDPHFFYSLDSDNKLLKLKMPINP